MVFFLPNTDMSLLCSFIANTIRGASAELVLTEKTRFPDNAQTVPAEWIILTHLIDVAYNRYHIPAQHGVWKCPYELVR